MSKSNQLKPGDAAPSGIVQTADEQSIDISSLWADGPIVLTFLRHFG